MKNEREQTERTGYTPEQIAEACAAADSFCATPAKNTLSVRKLRVLAEIVREQEARITALEAENERLRKDGESSSELENDNPDPAKCLYTEDNWHRHSHACMMTNEPCVGWSVQLGGKQPDKEQP